VHSITSSRNGTAITLIALAFVILTQGWSGVSVATAASPDDMNVGFLKTDGRKIVDQVGNTVILRGANFFGYEYGVGIEEKWNMHSEADYRMMASWGFNVVRLPIAWSVIEPEPGKYDENYLSYVDREIGWAKANGLYVILDMHDNSWSPHFKYYDPWNTAGVPSWAVSKYPDSAEGEARARADFWNDAGPNGTSVSSDNPSLRDRFLAVWKYVASRYVSETDVAGYDLLNEPTVFARDDTTCYYDYHRFVSETLPVFYEEVANAIRTADTEHMIFWEPAQIPLIWDNPSEYLGLMSTYPTYVDLANAVYSPHYPGIGPGLSLRAYNGDKVRLESSLRDNVLSLSERWNQPVFIGEWGLTSEGGNAAQYIHDVSDLQDKYLLSSAWWTYGYCSFGMCVFDDYGKERTTITGNLIRPYVRVSSAVSLSSEVTVEKEEFLVNLQGPGVLKIAFPAFYHLTAVKVNGQLVISKSRPLLIMNTVSITLTGQASQVTVGFS